MEPQSSTHNPQHILRTAAAFAYETIGHNKVRVPGFYYEVVYDETPPEKMIAFILPNKGSNKPVESFVVTVDDVEEATGLDFFSALPEDVQRRLESKSNPKDWTWK